MYRLRQNALQNSPPVGKFFSMKQLSYLKLPVLFLLYFVFAVLITWPLLLHISTFIPIGTERTTTIPLFGLWSLLWNTRQVTGLFQNYWNAPFFYPAGGTFAFSETMLPQGLVFALGLFITGRPLLVYNLMLLCCLGLNGLAAFSLLRRVGISDFPAVIAGLFAVALPYAANEMGVCQLIVLFPIFYFFSYLYAFSRCPQLKNALLTGLWASVLSLSCSYYGLFLSFFAFLGAVCLFDRKVFSFKAIIYLCCGIGLAVLAVMPVLIPQLMITSGFSHGEAATHLQSCRPVDYLAFMPIIFGFHFVPWLVERGAFHPMYPGTGLLILALAGVWFGREKAPRWVLFCFLGFVLAMLLSMSGNIGFGGWNLMDFLKGFYPGFKQLRNAFRFGVFTQIFLVCLAGFTLEKIYRLNVTRGPLLLMLVFLVSIVEVLPVTRLRPVPAQTFSAAWSDFLAGQPQGPAVMIPMAKEDERVDFNYRPIVVGMIHALHHEKPLVNGFSSFRPPAYLKLKEKMQSFPDRSSLACLCDSGVVYLVVDKHSLTPAAFSALNRQTQLALLYADDLKNIYRLECTKKGF